MQQQNSRRPSNSQDEPFLRFLAESHYLESEQSSSETQQQTLTKCKTEHALQPMQQYSSHSFNVYDKKHKFTFPTHEILEWETLQLSYPPEVFHFLQFLKTQCHQGNIIYLQEQVPQLILDSKAIIKSPKEFFNKLVERGWILRTSRQFNDSVLNFYALGIKKLTYENLVWILKSIKKDLITPTERLVQSRVKECFGIKLHTQEWEHIMNSLKSLKHPIKFRNSNGKLIELPQIFIKSIQDPLIKETTYGIYLQQPWLVEDEVQNDLEKKPEWGLFTEFLKDFFSQVDKNNKILKGGRYGCAQYIKLLGPKKLRDLSLGRLTLYVQMAVNKGFLKYNKTILMQESLCGDKSEHTTDSSVDGDPLLQKKRKELQLQLIELLLENPEGVSLAQIPNLLKDRVNFEINLTELGFPKLKNFIESVKDVIQVENTGKNNFIAKVIVSKIPQKMLQKIQQKVDSSKDRSKVGLALNIIKCIVSKHKYGLSMNQLYHDLSSQLGEWFPFQRFQCNSFFQFLQQYADHIIVIVCQKETQYWIYERNLKFLPPPSPTNEMNDQQFEQILSEAFPCSLGLSLPHSSFSSSWLGRASDSHIRQVSPHQIQRVEDSHQEIKENLRFIDELLGNDSKWNETYSIQDWSVQSMNPWGMLSSINYGDCDNFDLNKELQKKG